MKNQSAYGNGMLSVVKGVFFSLSISLLSSLFFACVLRAVGLSEKWIYPVNQVLKGVAIVAGVFLSVRGEKGLVKGGGIALAFTALSYLAFSAIGGDFSLSWLILVEILSAFGIGGISGAISVNLRK